MALLLGAERSLDAVVAALTASPASVVIDGTQSRQVSSSTGGLFGTHLILETNEFGLQLGSSQEKNLGAFA